MKKGNFFNVIEGDGVARILLYGDVGDGQRVDSARVVAELMSIAGRTDKIAVHINSKGGDVFSGIAIYNALKSITAEVSIYIDGVAASIAAIIALCGKPLYMSRHAKLMLHAVSGGAWGNADELRKTADMIEELQEELANMIAARCKLSANEIVATYFDGDDHWMSANDALQMNLIDGIYDMEATPSSESTTEELYNFINQYKQEDMALIDDIKKMPAFAGKSDEEIVASVREHANSAVLVDSLKKANEQLKERISTLEAKEVTAVLDQAIAEGKISQEQKATYANLMKSDRENTEALLASMPKKQIRINDYIGGPSGNDFSNKTWDELDKSGRLPDLKNSNPALFAQKYEEKFHVPYKD